MQNSEDANIMLSQFTYDPWDGLTQACDEIVDKNQGGDCHTPREKRAKRKTDNIKNKARSTAKSYVMHRQRTKGLRLIQIKVFDIANEPTGSFRSVTRESDVYGNEEDNMMLSAQYVVSEAVDEIMDMTETVIRKISKKLCSDNL